MNGWTVAQPTTTSIWLVLLGFALLYAVRTLELIAVRATNGLARRRIWAFAGGLFTLGLGSLVLSVLAYFAGAA